MAVSEVIDYEVVRAVAVLSEQIRPAWFTDPLAWANREFMEVVFVITLAGHFGWDLLRVDRADSAIAWARAVREFGTSGGCDRRRPKRRADQCPRAHQNSKDPHL